MGKTRNKLSRVLGTIIGLVIVGFFVFHTTPPHGGALLPVDRGPSGFGVNQPRGEGEA